MTIRVEEISKYVKRTFGDEADVQISDEDIIRWVNAGQRELSTRNNILRGIATADLVHQQTEYDLSGIPILKIQTLHISGKPIENRSFQHAEEYLLSADPERLQEGIPQIWFKWGNTINFWPKPDKDIPGGIKIFYIAMPSEVQAITDVLSIPDEYYNRIVEYVLSQAYELDEDPETSNLKLQQFTDGLSRNAGDHDRPQNETYSTITILPEDAW